jgi:nucleoside phosphorylase
MFNPSDYTVGWICAIKTEYVAAIASLDEKYDRPTKLPSADQNDYTLGRIRDHKVVISVLPMGEYGLSSATQVAVSMTHAFPNIRIALMVGIGGGAPSAKHDIRLGDIVVGMPNNGRGGILQYDFGKIIQGQDFKPTAFHNQAPTLLRGAVNGLAAEYETEGSQIVGIVSKILETKPRLKKKYSRPDPTTDRLYKSDVLHPVENESPCAITCGEQVSSLVSRPPRTEEDDDPAIHYGLIASANSLMKDAKIRDAFAEQNDVLCFEMEAAGLVNHFPCLVIRGICDYSDTHKNKEWQGYAAMTAAAYAKELLYRIVPHVISQQEAIANVVNEGDHYNTNINNYVREGDGPTNITFGGNNSGFQIGMNNGSINGTRMGGGP